MGNSMAGILRNVIRNGGMPLMQVNERIETMYLTGRINAEEREELTGLMHEKASPENEKGGWKELYEALAAKYSELEKRVKALETAVGGEAEGGEEGAGEIPEWQMWDGLSGGYVRGDVVAFGGRVLDKSDPKYVNTQETVIYSKRRNLYGINLAKKTKRPNIILCEGNIDVITLHQAGFDNAVASMGTALTTEQTRLLSRYTKELVLCYDNDTAGQLATQKAIALLENSEFSVRVLQLPKQLVDGEYIKQDVDDFIKHHGAAAFEAILNGSENQMDFRMEAVARKHDLTQAKERSPTPQRSAP